MRKIQIIPALGTYCGKHGKSVDNNQEVKKKKNKSTIDECLK